MFLYEENKDKVLVYEFSPKKDDILDYKKAYFERTPNSKLFYLYFLYNCFYRQEIFF
mgnify:CR=1 FL=1